MSTKRRIRRNRIKNTLSQRSRARPRVSTLSYATERPTRYEVPPDAHEGLKAWMKRSDLGAVYGVVPPDDVLAEVELFVATLAPEVDRELAYAAVLMAMSHCSTTRSRWQSFDVAFFAVQEVGAYFEGTHEEKQTLFEILASFFTWLATQGELTERELATVHANLAAARTAIADADEDCIVFGNVVDPTTGEPIRVEGAAE